MKNLEFIHELPLLCSRDNQREHRDTDESQRLFNIPKCWITAVKDCWNLATASDERVDISSRPKATFLSQRIIKPDVIRAKGVSPVIISLQWNTQKDCMKAFLTNAPVF